jgi:1-acyl-sn-glycerol-3-phosphate acyltransferase
MLHENGPLIIAANHPNSFLDAIIVATLFKTPVHSLARGDVFKKPFHRKLLKQLHMLPIYRVSEGVENLEINYQTFNSCREIFKENGIVLIFSEGGCVNEWKLRPLKKGTARLAISSWKEGIPLRILPLGINYSSFRRFGKNVELHFGEMIEPREISQGSEGKYILEFNSELRKQLEQLVVQIPSDDKASIKRRFYKPVPALIKGLLFAPAILGFVIHAPLYYPLRAFTKKVCNDNDHFDSIVVAIHFVAYPIYVLLLTILCVVLTGSEWSWLLLILIPLVGRAWVEVKGQMDK